MFEWFSNLFKANDPEAGIPAGQDTTGAAGRPEGPNEGTGEGWGSGGGGGGGGGRDKYAQMGKAAQAQMVGPSNNPSLIPSGPVTAGFDMNWLGEQESAGSANGAKL